MSVRVVVFRAVGLLGCASLAFGVRTLYRLPGCPPGMDSCDVPLDGGLVATTAWAFGLGLVALVVGLAGRGGYVPLLPAAFGALAAVCLLEGAQRPILSLPWWWSLGLGGLMATWAVSIVVEERHIARAASRRARVLDAGVRAAAQVVQVRRVGAEDDCPREARLVLDVTPSDESEPFRVELTLVIAEPPRPGDRLAVRLDPAERAWLLVDDAAPPPPPLHGTPLHGTPDAGPVPGAPDAGPPQ